MQLMLIDAIGPFFRHVRAKRINWSKVPFRDLETEDGLRPECLETIPEDFARFAKAARSMGYDALTLDDVAHLVPDPGYPAGLSARIAAYRALYRRLFAIAADEGLRVFVTTDVMFYDETLRQRLGRSHRKAAAWMAQALRRLFSDFPEVAGVVMRFGETDGIDVRGDFRSRLLLKSPRQARRFLRRLLPVFEDHGRTLVFRTWSVGAHRIGDLIWNERTFRRVFDGLDSPSLVVSMKYGESDFFRYLPANPLFFLSDHRKIVEFQARREYEGFGAYPSFVGWDAERTLQELRGARNVIGASVWCQTGGWGKRRQLTFVRNSSPWVELNAFVLARLCRGASCEEAVASYARARQPHVRVPAMLEFLRRSEVVIKDLLYVREFAERRLFFRRLRLPPQLFVFWDRIVVNHTMKRLASCLISDPEAAIRQGEAALEELHTMRRLATEHGIPRKGLDLQCATFELLAAARAYFFRPYDPEVADRLRAMKAAYKTRFRRRYSVLLDFDEAPLRRIHLQWALALMVRDRHRYRLVDQVVTLRFLSWIYPFVSRFGRRLAPRFAQEQAMGVDVLFK